MAFFVRGCMRELETRQGNAFYAFFGAVLIKAEEIDGKWSVYLEASNEDLDLDEETVLQKALKDAADYYLQHGVISWDHKQKVLHDPAFIIGEPIDVAFPDSKATLVKGFLYKENKRAQSLWENLLSKSTRFGSSVGGYVLNKSQQGQVNKVYWDEVAITHKPINDMTQGRTSIIPFKEFAKALMVGSGVDAAAFTSGRALVPESLQGAVADYRSANALPPEDLNNLFKDIFEAIKNERVVSYNDLISFVLERGYDSGVAAELIHFISSRLPETVGQLRR